MPHIRQAYHRWGRPQHIFDDVNFIDYGSYILDWRTFHILKFFYRNCGHHEDAGVICKDGEIHFSNIEILLIKRAENPHAFSSQNYRLR